MANRVCVTRENGLFVAAERRHDYHAESAVFEAKKAQVMSVWRPSGGAIPLIHRDANNKALRAQRGGEAPSLPPLWRVPDAGKAAAICGENRHALIPG